MAIDDRIVREREARQMTGLCRSSRYRLEKQNLFPQRVRISRRSVGYREPEILAWIRSRTRNFE